MIWTPYGGLSKLYNLYMTAVVDIISKCGLTIEHAVETNLIRLSWHCKYVAKSLLLFWESFKEVYISYKMECSKY